jgi:hypothetical protein
MDAQLQSDGHASPVSLIGYPWTRCHNLQMDVQHGSPYQSRTQYIPKGSSAPYPMADPGHLDIHCRLVDPSQVSGMM